MSVIPSREWLDEAELYAVIRREVQAAGGQSAFARKLGISAAYVSQIVNAHREPSDAVLARIGLRRVVRYMRDAQ